MLSRQLNRANVVKPLRFPARRRPRRPGREITKRFTRNTRNFLRSRGDPLVQVGPRRGPTLILVATRNNFWGIYRAPTGGGYRVVSAGGMPGLEGSKRGRPAAATAVIEVLRNWWTTLHPHRPFSRHRRRARKVVRFWRVGFKKKYTRHRRPRRRFLRRLRRKSIRTLRRLSEESTTVGGLPVRVVLRGWSRDRRWQTAWQDLRPLGRVTLEVHPRRSHNGLRPVRRRRQ